MKTYLQKTILNTWDFIDRISGEIIIRDYEQSDAKMGSPSKNERGESGLQQPNPDKSE